MLPDHISLFTSMYTLNNGITPHAVGQVNGYQKLLDLTAALGHHPLSTGDVKALVDGLGGLNLEIHKNSSHFYLNT